MLIKPSFPEYVYGKNPYAAEEDVSSYSLTAKTGTLLQFSGIFWVVFRGDFRFMVTSLKSRGEHGSEN